MLASRSNAVCAAIGKRLAKIRLRPAAKLKFAGSTTNVTLNSGGSVFTSWARGGAAKGTKADEGRTRAGKRDPLKIEEAGYHH